MAVDEEMIHLALMFVLNTTPYTELHDVRDLTFSIPNFVTGERQDNTEELLDLLYDLYGDKYEITMWHGNMIVKEK